MQEIQSEDIREMKCYRHPGARPGAAENESQKRQWPARKCASARRGKPAEPWLLCPHERSQSNSVCRREAPVRPLRWRAPESPGRQAATRKRRACAEKRRSLKRSLCCRRTATPRAARFSARPRMCLSASSSVPSLHLHVGGIRGGEYGWLIHRLHRRRTDAELARVHDLEHVDIFLVAAEVRLEKRGVIVMEFAARIPPAPPVGAVPDFVHIIALHELAARRNGSFHQQVSPLASVHAEPDCNHVAGVHVAGERLEIVNDPVAHLLRRQAVVVAGDVERELVVLEILL